MRCARPSDGRHQSPTVRGTESARRIVTFCGLGVSLACLALAANADERPISPQDRNHWAFQPVVRPSLPPTREPAAALNAIDAFLTSRLAAQGLTFSAPAGRRDLLRRASFDLIGLPPSADDIEEFLEDDAPEAFERRVDRLLASPQHGEHWGRMWLDVVRYAETAGFNADPLRPHAWKYRDYVIAAFNADTPFDRFIQEQIAGDELFPDDPRSAIASGYVLMWPDESNASNILLARQEALNDLTANVGAAFLGLSIGCAQCHDHKFDPLPQHDFYRLQAFFSGLVRRDQAELGSAAQIAAFRAADDRWLAETASLREELRRLEQPARIKAAGDRRMKFPQVVLDALDTLPEDRTTLQRQIAFWSERQIEIKEADVAANLSDEQKQRRSELQSLLAKRREERPRPPSPLTGMIAGEIDAQPPATHLLAGGSYDKPQEEIAPGFLSVLAADGTVAAEVASPHPYTSGRRSALARWLSDPQHPLTPRVLVNRLWQGHFGRGLVENANDFGTQTPPPSHPELLDWLTAEFLSPGAKFAVSSDGGWSMKRLHRLIVTSAAYRQSSQRMIDPSLSDQRGNTSLPAGRDPHTAPGAFAADPDNRLYWHFPRRRLTAEALRDSLLAACGELNSMVSGPSVHPELPPDFSRREAWKVSASSAERRRRSIYIHVKRNLPYPLLEAFDLPDMHESCARRTETTVAPQALLLLNSGLILDYSRALAGRVLEGNPHAAEDSVIAAVFRRTLGRPPAPWEADLAATFLSGQQSLAEARRAEGHAVLLPAGFPKYLDPARAAAVVDLCHALLNANEFVYLD